MLKDGLILQVIDPCTMRNPNSFLVSWMTTAGVDSMIVQSYHQPGLPVDTRIRLPKNVDICKLAVRISAKNSAGMSSPTEIAAPVGESFTHTRPILI